MQALTGIALRFPRSTLALALLAAVWAAVGLPRSTPQVGYRVMVGDDHPAIAKLDHHIDRFNGGLPIIAVWGCDDPSPCESVYDESAIRMAKQVEAALIDHPLVLRVSTPVSSGVVLQLEDGVSIRQFLEDDEVPPDIDRLAARALESENWHGQLISPDGRVGAIIVELESTESNAAAEIVPALQSALAPFEAQGFEFHLAGDPVDFVVAGEELRRESPRLFALMFVLTALIVYLLTRSSLATTLAMGTSILGVLITMGTVAWLAWPQVDFTQALPGVILVIGLCDAVHLISHYGRVAATNPNADQQTREQWMLDAVTRVGPACFITSLTTAVAFLSFATSTFDSFVRFGATAAAGIMMVLLLSLTVLPVLIVRLTPRRIQANQVQKSWDDALLLTSEMVSRQHVPILWITSGLFLLGTIGLTQMRIDADGRDFLRNDSQISRWSQYIEDNLREPESLEIAISLPEGQFATEPAVAKKIEEITRFLPTVDGLDRTTSYLDYIGPINRLLHEDDPAWERAADTRAGNAQLILALEIDLDRKIHDWVTPDHQELRIFVQAETLPAVETHRAVDRVTRYLESTIPAGWGITLTGPLLVHMELVEELHATHLRSFAFAAIIIAFLFYLFLRTTGSGIRSATKWTFIGLGPSVFPVVATLGTMGVLGVPMDATTAMLAAIVLGIAVDDTFHIINAYRRERAAGAEPSDAILTGIRTVGRALVTTSTALSIGFFALAFSPWQSIASFGFLAGIAIITALIADLIVLPSIILTLARARARDFPPERVRPSPVLTRRQRMTFSVAIIVVVSSITALSLDSLLSHESKARLACWVYPNRVVALTSALSRECPLAPQDQLAYVEVAGKRYRPNQWNELELALEHAGSFVSARVERGRERIWVDVPIVRDSAEERLSRFTVALTIAGSMLSIALFLLWCSSSSAILPLGILYCCLSTASTYFLCSVDNELPAPPYVFALCMIPPVMLHLSLNFPYQRAILRQNPSLLYFSYGAGALLFCAGLYGYFESAMLWQRASATFTVMAATCWSVLVIASSIARGESASALERARARSAFWGSLLIPVVLVSALASDRFDGSYVAAWGALLVPLPIGYAMARYQLFDPRPHARRVAFSIAFSLLYTGVLTLGWYLFNETSASDLETTTATKLGLLFVLLLSAELIRSQSWNVVRRRIPSVESHLRDFEESTSRDLRSLSSEEDTARLLADSVQSGLDTLGVSTFLSGERGWRLAAARGESPVEVSEVEAILRRMDIGDDPIQLGLEGGAEGGSADELRELGLALIAPLRCRGDLLAILLVKEARNRMPFTLSEISFVGRLCSHTAVTLHNARLSSELLRVERYSTIGRIATGLMHDIGKPMAIVWQRAKKMARDSEMPPRVREAASSIETMTDDALSSIDRLMEHAREGLTNPVAEVSAAQVIERAVDAVTRMHNSPNVCVRLTPDLPRVSGSDELHLALINFLDNALLASDPDEVTDIFATANGEELKIQIIDRGCGMSPTVQRHAFDPFYTTRADAGGSGIGLAASRTTIERLGGTVSLESEEGVGTTVTIRLAIRP